MSQIYVLSIVKFSFCPKKMCVSNASKKIDGRNYVFFNDCVTMFIKSYI